MTNSKTTVRIGTKSRILAIAPSLKRDFEQYRSVTPSSWHVPQSVLAFISLLFVRYKIIGKPHMQPIYDAQADVHLSVLTFDIANLAQLVQQLTLLNNTFISFRRLSCSGYLLM